MGTFKQQKTDYRREGYDRRAVPHPLYLLDGEKYISKDDGLHEDVLAGRVTLR